MARIGAGISPGWVAKQAGLDDVRYAELESASGPRNRSTLSDLVSIGQQLGLDSVRVAYVNEIGQYMKIALSKDGRSIPHVDSLDADAATLKKREYFVSPHAVLAFVAQAGFRSILSSTELIDKQIVELWTAAVFSISLGQGHDYYVRLVNNDPPDAEVLAIKTENGDLSMVRAEITRHGPHSTSLFDVIAKKLGKKYQQGTAIVVLVERSESLQVAELHRFIRENNRHGQRIVIIGGGERASTFKVVPSDRIFSPLPGYTAWKEYDVGVADAGRGHQGYEGLVFEPPALAARGESRAAFDRRCITPNIVAPRSKMHRYAPSSRLVGRAPHRSRCDTDFHHGLLEAFRAFPVFVKSMKLCRTPGDHG